MNSVMHDSKAAKNQSKDQGHDSKPEPRVFEPPPKSHHRSGQKKVHQAMPEQGRGVSLQSQLIADAQILAAIHALSRPPFFCRDDAFPPGRNFDAFFPKRVHQITEILAGMLLNDIAEEAHKLHGIAVA